MLVIIKNHLPGCAGRIECIDNCCTGGTLNDAFGFVASASDLKCDADSDIITGNMRGPVAQLVRAGDS